MIYFKKIQSEKGLIVVLCDKDLYGKEFSEGEAILIINDFYKGEEVNDVDKETLDNAILINAIGKESIEILIKHSIITKEDLKEVKYIKGVPYVFVVKDEI